MIGFRVDANEIISMGHLMRCISIAEEIRTNGEKVIFYLAQEKCIELLLDRNFEYVVLNSDWQKLDMEVEILEKYIQEYKLSWLVIDSYQVTREYVERLQQSVKVMAVDLPEDKKYNVSALLNYSHIIASEHLRRLYADTDTIILDNLMYAPLRKQFRNVRKDCEIKMCLMVTTGGSDPNHISLNFVKKILEDSRFKDYKICVVLGKLCTDKENIMELDSDRVEVLFNISNMYEVMNNCDVCFSAGGSTVIELCACRVPSIVFSFVDNQIPFSKILSEAGVIDYIGDIREQGNRLYENAIEEIYKLISDDFLYKKMQSKMKNICDGCGAQRIAEKMCS